MNKQQRYPIGATFTERRGRGAKQVTREHTVIDVLRTYNSADELVSLRYVTSYMLMGQAVVCRDVVEATIARCLAADAA